MSYISYIERLIGIRGKNIRERNKVVYRGYERYREYMIERRSRMK